MEFASRTPNASIWPAGAAPGTVKITHDLMADKPDLVTVVSAVSYTVQIAQEGRPVQEGIVLSDQQPVSFQCDLATSAPSLGAQAPAPQARPAGIRLPAQEDILAMLKTGHASAAIVVAAFLLALLWGAGHALTPGHGKAIVAAYLIGSRSTARHAVFLGLTVTATHTIGVFALGLVALFASRYVDTWRIYPWLGTASGLIVAALGAAMLVSRLRVLSANSGRPQPHDHAHDPEHGHDHSHAHADHHHDHGHGLEHDHDHSHAHNHDHDHAPGEHHHDHHDHHHGPPPHRSSHGRAGGHSHLPPGADGGPVTWRSLLGLGISGGLLPCPSALVLLLAAVAVKQTALGIALVVAFSLGLAAVLTAIGLLFVKGGRLIARIPHGTRALRFVPIASAIFILLVGLWLAVRAALTIRL
jgi:ABC-type nickel/cobalt efflux system permease component RcnA